MTLLGLLLHGCPPNFLQTLELKTYDARLQSAHRPANPNIVIVEIDQKTLDELGSWPFSRRHYVTLIERLAEGGAKVIGLDVTFPMPDGNTPGADERFAEAIRRAGNVVLGQFFFMEDKGGRTVPGALPGAYALAVPENDLSTPLPYTGPPIAAVQPNLPLLAAAAGSSAGYLNVFADPDSVFRRVNLALEHQDRFYPPLAVQVLRRYRDVPQEDLALIYGPDGVQHIQLGKALNIPTDGMGRVLINYQAGAAKSYSMADILAGKVGSGVFRGKIVLVGATAPGIGDIRPTPLGLVPGVEVHAHLLDTVLSAAYIGSSPWIDRLIILLCGLGMTLLLPRLRPGLRLPATVAALALVGSAGCAAMAWARLWLSVVTPILVLLGSALLATADGSPAGNSPTTG